LKGAKRRGKATEGILWDVAAFASDATELFSAYIVKGLAK